MPAPLTRQTLLVRIRDGRDDAAWSDFVGLYGPLIFNFCQRRGLQPSDAADVVQDTLQAVARHAEGFRYDRSRGTFRSWLYTVARSKLNNYFRASGRRPENPGDTAVGILQDHADASPVAVQEHDEAWENDYRRRVFTWAAKKVRPAVSEKAWDAFWRVAVEDENAAEVASDLGMKPGALYVAKCRVMRRLRDTIESAGDGWEHDLLETQR